MKKCLIVTSFIDRFDVLISEFRDECRDSYDCVIAADYGYVNCEKLGIVPDILIGDFDSSELPQDCDNLILLPTHKDMTDSEAAIDRAADLGFQYITVLGGLGGRFDHTVGNLGILAKYTDIVSYIGMEDGLNRVFMSGPTGDDSAPGSPLIIKKDRFKYLGLAAWTREVTGLTTRGVAYPLTDFTLSSDTTRGACNEIMPGENALITFRTGKLIIIQSNDA